MPLRSIVVTPPSPSLIAGQTQQFIATGVNNNGTTDDLTGTATWSSSDPTVVSISGTGLATALADGDAVISAASSGILGATTISVDDLAIVAIAVYPITITLAPGQSQQYGAVATCTDGSQRDVTTRVTWGSSDYSIATIDPNGFAQVLAAGLVEITATSGVFTAAGMLSVPESALPPAPIPGSPADFLRQAQQAMFQLLLGNKPSRVDTPQLGSVEFQPTSPDQLQRVIDYLQGLVDAGNTWDAASGNMNAGYTRGRKPFSFFGWP